MQVLVDGVTQLDPNTGEPMSVDLYAPTSTYTEAYVASPRLTAGPHTVTFVTTASNPSSRSVRDHGVFDHGSSIGIDFLRLTWTSP